MVLGGRVCSHCSTPRQKQMMIAVKRHFSAWADSWWSTFWFCSDKTECKAAAVERVRNSSC